MGVAIDVVRISYSRTARTVADASARASMMPPRANVLSILYEKLSRTDSSANIPSLCLEPDKKEIPALLARTALPASMFLPSTLI
ncbi:hypothetical protein D9M72_599230 [compost metagenome]